MNILVTGGAGFIGSHLVDKLIQKNHSLIVVDDLSTGQKSNLNPKAKFYQIKIQSPKLDHIFKREKPDIIYHLAAQMDVRKSITDPIFDANTNIIGSLNLLQNCIKYKTKKIIFFSTGGAIYGDKVKTPTPETALEQPLSPYGIAKLSIEKYVYFYFNQYKLPYTILRLANVYGPRQNHRGEAGVVAIFCHQLINNQSLYINGNGNQTRDFVYVDDVVQAGIKALPRAINGIYNIGTAKETNINQLARKLIQTSRKQTKIKHRAAIRGEQQKSCLSFQKAKTEINWRPGYDLNGGLQETWKYFNNF